MEKGYIQLYTGNGKGKTTAAMGLAFRASGCGLKTLMIQFMKGQDTSENKAAVKSSFINIEQYGLKEFFVETKSDIIGHRGECRKALNRAAEVLKTSEYDILILDEIINALKYNLVSFEEVIELINAKPEKIEMILTGRDAPEALYEYCDLITKFDEVKHYYKSGVNARKGIEF
ncbi:MAG: cob(I)yrinic acid a,c-diamide adenosyltransferase [Spirochaetes bacterium]|nr:cob(I)yrinic acid a,c-diamide adenosyltransferase [Spirochaetota bacterium]